MLGLLLLGDLLGEGSKLEWDFGDEITLRDHLRFLLWLLSPGCFGAPDERAKPHKLTSLFVLWYHSNNFVNSP